jgi:nucleoside-diphosphate-sugar epimerase
MARSRLGWEPEVTLEEGLEKTYRWILSRVERKGK